MSTLEEQSTGISAIKSTQIVASIIIFLFLIARSPMWEMKWDASGYLNSSLFWVNGGSYDSEQLYYRGFLTSIVYWIPSFVGMKFLEPSVFGTYIFALVLIQNSFLITWMSTYLLPRIVKLFTPVTSFTIWATAIPSAYLMYGFAPYSQMDIWALACLLPVVHLIYSEKRSALVLSGLLLGFCLNLRPSYLFVILMLIVSVFIIKKFKVFLMLPGLIVSHIPQLIYNDRWSDALSIFPLGLGKITGRLATYAAYSIRYDSVANGPFTQGGLSFCDQKMKEIALIVKPQSTFETALLLLQNPEHSVPFFLKKLAASFWWPVTVPYYEHNPLVNSIFGAVVLFIVVFGLSRVISAYLSSDQKNRFLSVLAVSVGFLMNLALYSNETRYSLSIALISICGIAVFTTQFSLSTENVSQYKYFSKDNVITFAIYIFLMVIAVFTLTGEFGFQSISNCGL